MMHTMVHKVPPAKVHPIPQHVHTAPADIVLGLIAHVQHRQIAMLIRPQEVLLLLQMRPKEHVRPVVTAQEV